MKQYLLDMTWSSHSRTHSNCGELHKIHTRSSRQDSNMDREGAHKAPPQAEELLAVYGY